MGYTFHSHHSLEGGEDTPFETKEQQSVVPHTLIHFPKILYRRNEGFHYPVDNNTLHQAGSARRTHLPIRSPKGKAAMITHQHIMLGRAQRITITCPSSGP